MSYRSANPFSTPALMRRLAPMVEKFPRSYMGIITAMASIAYGALITVPVLLVISFANVYTEVTELANGIHIANAIRLGLWGLLTLYSAMLTWKLLRMKLALPQGLMIQTEKYPLLNTLLQKTYDHFQVKPVSRVVITERFEVTVTYTPRFGLPLWSTATLCLGLPVLQSLSSKHFSCLLTGKIGQHAAPYSRWLHQLTRSQQLFSSYQQYFNKHRSWITFPLRLFFQGFQSIFTKLSVFVTHAEELEADRYSLELYSDSDLLDTMLTSIACQQYLQKVYWPGVVNRLRKESPQQAMPHARMGQEIRRALATTKASALLHDVYKTDFNGKDPFLPLKKRMENIGYDKLRAPSILIKNASHELLADNEKKIIDLMDKLWVSRNLADWKKVQQKRHRKQTMLEQLEKQSSNRLLTAEELWKQARLTEKLRGAEQAIPYYQSLLKKDAQHAMGLYAYGRILLSRGDREGIALLERSMANDAKLTPQACMLLFKFLLKHNQKEQAMQYRNRGLSFRQQHAA